MVKIRRKDGMVVSLVPQGWKREQTSRSNTVTYHRLSGKDHTLAEAREWLRDHREEGASCPCCGQLAKVYYRKLNARMARALITMWKERGTDWCHVPTVVGDRGGDATKLVYWGLIEETTEKREDGGRAGWWRVTADGERFVKGQLMVPGYARVYNKRCLGVTGELVGIQDALGSKFNYDELMHGELPA